MVASVGPEHRPPHVLPRLVFYSVLHVLGLAIFISGFILTRVHLPNRAVAHRSLNSTTPGAPPPFDRAIILVIDALRYDMVFADGRYSCDPGKPCHQGRMPFLTSLAQYQEGVEAGFRFVAEAPTTTLQRLKCLVTGGPPSFFDIGNSFSAGALHEDNLIDQAVAAGKRVAFLGDTTWTGLFPHQFSAAHGFPCFNVRDLDTVDDGVALHMPRFLADPGAWDLLVAHTLGVDHAGHAHGVASSQMLSKLAQTDGLVRGWVESMLRRAGPGQPFENALLLVLGDHGQTLSGDHGGGSDPEVDSALVAVSLGALARAGAGARDVGAPPGPPGAPPAHSTSPGTMAQADFVASLAPMLGLPTPFGNLGRVQAELFGLAQSRGGCLEAAARANVEQVMQYLEAYAAEASFPAGVLGEVQRSYAELGSRGELDGEEARTRRLLLFLERAAALARPQWTQFGLGRMAAGLAVLATVAALQARDLFAAARLHGRSAGGMGRVDALVTLAMLGCTAFQTLGIFSFFYLLNEAWATQHRNFAHMPGAWVVTSTAACWALVVLGATLSSRSSTLRLACILDGLGGGAALVLAAALGLTQHSGRQFWQRLTVHDMDAATWTGKAMVTSLLRMLRPSPEHLGPAPIVAASLAAALPAAALGWSTCAACLRVGRRWEGSLQPPAAARLVRVGIGLAFACAAAHHAMRAFLDAGGAGRHGSPALPVLGPVLRVLGVSRLLSREASHIVVRAGLTAATAAGVAAAGQRAVARAFPALAPAAVLAAVTIVSGPGETIVLLCLLCQMWAAGRVTRRCAGEPWAGLRGALLWASLSMQAFYCTGHVCEFAGIDWTAGFVASDEFHLYGSGSLVALETFGAMLLVPVASLAMHGRQAHLVGSGEEGEGDQPSSISGSHWTGARTATVTAAVRSGTLFATALSAAVQRRHLYAWALFAPRFAFEACFALVTDLALVAATVT